MNCAERAAEEKDMLVLAKEEVNIAANEPALSQVRSIWQLATLECYYHNVEKSAKTKGTGLAHVGEKERKFWSEYTGVAKIGIDMSDVNMKVDGTSVEITIPDAKWLYIILSRWRSI